MSFRYVLRFTTEESQCYRHQCQTVNDYRCCLVSLDQRARRSERRAVWVRLVSPKPRVAQSDAFYASIARLCTSKGRSASGAGPVLSCEDYARRRPQPLAADVWHVSRAVSVIHTKSASQKPKKLVEITFRSLENRFWFVFVVFGRDRCGRRYGRVALVLIGNVQTDDDVQCSLLITDDYKVGSKATVMRVGSRATVM